MSELARDRENQPKSLHKFHNLDFSHKHCLGATKPSLARGAHKSKEGRAAILKGVEVLAKSVIGPKGTHFLSHRNPTV
jgi:hypothetical protein